VFQKFHLGDDALAALRMYLLALAVAVLMLSVSFTSLFFAKPQNQIISKMSINVSCVGDSITEWSGYTNRLQEMLGDGYKVGNFGVAGSAVSTEWFKPYVEQSAFQDSMDFNPSIVVIMLGTNDAHIDQGTDSFVNDYESLVADYAALPGDQQIILVKPPPIYDNDLGLDGASFQCQVMPLIQQVADNLSLPLLDVYSALMNHPDYFVDGVHPNSDGATAIAMEIDQAITLDDYAAGPPF
jgi:lysophospholipase L1-like esterase